MHFEKNELNPLEADVIIIDEMSMVDIHLFQSLLKAIAPGTRLVMVGDRNQLPSVGPGQVLKDLMESLHAKRALTHRSQYLYIVDTCFHISGKLLCNKYG